MKRLSRYTALALVTGALVASARPAPGAALIGVRGGMTLARQVGNDALADKSRLGFSGGVFTTMRVTDWLAIEPDMMFVTKGGKLASESTDQAGNVIKNPDADYTVNYLELAVLSQIGLPALGIVRPSFLVGPSVAVELGEHLKFHDLYGGSSKPDYLKDNDVGAVLGLGFEAGAGTLRWLLDARYELSVINLERPERGDGPIRNSSIFLSAGVGWSPSD